MTLVIVARDQPVLYQYFRAALAALGNVRVILDRRLGERRQRVEVAAVERRRADRRCQPSRTQELRARGFIIVPAAHTLTLAPRVGHACPVCQAAIPPTNGARPPVGRPPDPGLSPSPLGAPSSNGHGAGQDSGRRVGWLGRLAGAGRRALAGGSASAEV